MKGKAWDEQLLADYRRYIRTEDARQAFDVLVAAAIQLPEYACRPNKTKSSKKDFAFDDPESGERPFAFIVNRNDLLFYVRQAGLTRVPGGVAKLENLFPHAEENNSGEWKVRIRSPDGAERLIRLLFGDTRSSPEAWRVAPRSAARIFDVIFEGTPFKVRRSWEAFLADSVEYVAAKFPGRWGISLFQDALRFNVGQTESIVLWHEEGRILLSPSSAPSGISFRDRPYPSAGGCRLASVRLSSVHTLRSLRDSHQEAMDLAAKRTPIVAIKAAHSPGVLRYLEEVLGRRLPNPSYAVGAANDRAREAEELAEDRALAARPDLPETEKEALRKYRCGQGLFRDRVSALEPCCRMTGIKIVGLLRASHIKPWKDSTDQERLDGNNGLFLAPHIDALFDQGLISFSDKGNLLLSKKLDRSVLGAWGIPKALSVGKFRSEQCKYLAWHRKAFGFGGPNGNA